MHVNRLIHINLCIHSVWYGHARWRSWTNSFRFGHSLIKGVILLGGCFPGGSVVKNLLADAGDSGDVGSISGLGRSPGRGNGNPLQYSCLENPMDRGSWWATVHRIAKSQTQLIYWVHTHEFKTGHRGGTWRQVVMCKTFLVELASKAGPREPHFLVFMPVCGPPPPCIGPTWVMERFSDFWGSNTKVRGASALFSPGSLLLAGTSCCVMRTQDTWELGKELRPSARSPSRWGRHCGNGPSSPVRLSADCRPSWRLPWERPWTSIMLPSSCSPIPDSQKLWDNEVIFVSSHYAMDFCFKMFVGVALLYSVSAVCKVKELYAYIPSFLDFFPT